MMNKFHPRIKFARSLILMLLVSLFVVSDVTRVFAYDRDYYSSNSVLYYNPDEQCNPSTGAAIVAGDSNPAKIYNYLVGRGLTAEQAGGILGNIAVESGHTFSPSVQEFSKRWPSGGYGIVQWTASRRIDVVNAIEKTDSALKQRTYIALYGDATSEADGFVPKGMDIADNDKLLGIEMDFLYQEATTRRVRSSLGYGSMTEWEAILQAKTLREASDIWYYSFERPRVQNETNGAARAKEGEKWLAKVRGQSSSSGAPNTAPSTTTSTTNSRSPVVFIDPGHGAQLAAYTDKETGLRMDQDHNTPETEDMLDVAKRVKTKLESMGYTVVLSRETNNDKSTFRQKAEKAIGAKAVIGVSLHSTPGEINQAWPQRVDTYREYNGKRTTFTNKETANLSENYASQFAEARTLAEGHPISVDTGNTQQTSSFSRSGILSKGNIPLISLFGAPVPWVYNEIAQDDGTGLSENRKSAYAEGVVDGITNSVPLSEATNNATCSDLSGGTGYVEGLANATLAYAHHKFMGKPYHEKKPEYIEAIKVAKSKGLYIGGCEGEDCGAFVTRLVMDSGWDPTYNFSGKGGATPTQRKWLETYWEKVGTGSTISTASLQPGDVAMQPGHTFIYVGKIPGFEKVIASASLCSRAPMAGWERLNDSSITWYRKKSGGSSSVTQPL
ncbi:MAG: phage tail tip lysozyme [Candidatus Saccharimonadaceae bacterium]